MDTGAFLRRAYISPNRASRDLPREPHSKQAVPIVEAPRGLKVFDIYTIIFLTLAVFIFFRLRSVLGQRTGR
jgi:hypothetical protein